MAGNNNKLILVINPGSTSTKLALFENLTQVWERSVHYSSKELASYSTPIDQFEMRKKDILTMLEEAGTALDSLSAIAARGGPFKPLASGVYSISEQVIEDIRHGRIQADHISNITSILAYEFAQKAQIPAFFVDPVSVDEMIDEARFSGIPEIRRHSLIHALNIKAVARMAASQLQKPLDTISLVVAHLGGGISICPVKQGRLIDGNNANEEGPFSPERAGSLPTLSLLKFRDSKALTHNQLRKHLVGGGGLAAYLGTHDLREIELRIDSGDDEARLAVQAMAYQISKNIGSMTAALGEKPEAIVLTGGGARFPFLVQRIEKQVSFLAPILVIAGEFEMEALAHGVYRVLMGEEAVKQY